MHDIHFVLQKLNEYFDTEKTTAETLQTSIANQLPSHIDLSVLTNNLTEICTECRQTRESDVFDNTHDSWEYFSKIISIEHLLALLSGLYDYARKNEKNFPCLKVLMIVCRTYVLLLTSPGAKIFDAFNTDLLRKVFKSFDVVKILSNFREDQRVQLQMLLTLLLEDFLLYLKHVSFEEYKDLQLQFIEAIASIMEWHHEKGYLNKYSFVIQELCYGALENACLPIHDSEITSSLEMVLNGTACLTRFHRPCSGSSQKPKYALITDWFIDMLKHFPHQTCETLTCYIQTILTDCDVTANKDLLNRYLDICAQYDAAMVRICGESISDFLDQLAWSKESQHRCNCVELISRMLVMNTKCDWELFRSELPKTPREIKLLKILLQKCYDSNNVVAMKAINAFLKIADNGNEICKEVLKKCFVEAARLNTPENIDCIEMDNINESDDLTDAAKEKQAENGNGNDNEEHSTEESESTPNKQTESQTVKDDYTKSTDYKELLREVNENVLSAVKVQLKNASALVRRVTILLLEFVATTNMNIDDLLTSYDFRQLYIDQSPLVRRQLILSLNQILNSKPSNEAAITAWIKMILDLANDIDQKVMETVVDSFKQNIFDKIENYEKSPSLSHVSPWRLLKSMLSCTDCPDFRKSVQKWMNKNNLLTSKTLSKIETHLDTNNATEAWILLAMVAPNIEAHNPERVSKLLLQNLKYDMTNTVENCYIQLEVLSFWLKYLKNPSKNEIKRLMTEMLMMGSLRPRNINRAFGICYKLSSESGDEDRDDCVRSIRDACESYIQTNQNSMFIPNLCDDRLINYLYLYSEIGSILECTLHNDIIDFFFTAMLFFGQTQRNGLRSDSMLAEKINCILNVLTGQSTFNQEICVRFVPHLGKILRTMDHSEVCFTAIKCLEYLCKKNTAVVETIVPYILMKTQHKYANIREFALKTLATLILEDYLKFRGTLLIYVLARMLDQQREIKELATELIMKYTLEKNDIFMRTCLLECPFVFNGCSCFGQSHSATQSVDILKGSEKKSAREYIYRYLIRKIEPVYLYMYFGNITRLLDLIQKEQSMSKSIDLQSSIADFLYICSEICIANEKQKKNLAKIIKDAHNGDELALNNENETTEAGEMVTGTGTDTTEKGRRGGKRNQPSIANALATVEKVVPLIADIDDILRPMNPTLFKPVIDKLCREMCGHFEALIEYAQPRTFWAKYLKNSKKIVPISRLTKPPTKTSSVPTVVDNNALDTQMCTSRRTKSRKDEENDSGQFTIEDVGENEERYSKRSASRSRTSKTIESSKKSSHTLSRGSDNAFYDDDSISDFSDSSTSSGQRNVNRRSKNRDSKKRKTISTK